MLDSRAEVVAVLPLVEVTTTDGPYRFILGMDGTFTDVANREWLGSSILGGGANEILIGDIAPRGTLSLTFIQDPGLPDTIAQMKALGVDYIYGLPVKFFVQPLASLEEVGRPTLPPILFMTRRQTGLTFNLDGPAQRSITLTYEGVGANGNQQRRQVYNTADHARLIGRANPSLQYIPQEMENDVSLFG
ncbi:hypothetical protein [Falsirhodobacter halotolerans]|uniref:hypothetical protein n=1 Tax=Falsirhodobacter halotolerans TaxID=1146892 RepID=UPI001FD165B3|nr:hypothetical protein [Falsirhodobacter halotolerans]MCJ8139561.1 hypothetical protein [Falsirhodobacter halotolerans]